MKHILWNCCKMLTMDPHTMMPVTAMCWGMDGSIVTGSGALSYLQIYSTIQDVLKDGENDENAIRQFSDALQSRASGTAVFDFEGEKQFLTFMPLMQKENWYYVSVIPLSMVEKDGTAIIMHTIKNGFYHNHAIAFFCCRCFCCFFFCAIKRRT